MLIQHFNIYKKINYNFNHIKNWRGHWEEMNGEWNRGEETETFEPTNTFWLFCGNSAFIWDCIYFYYIY